MRREILAARAPETLTWARFEHKLLLREEEALALEIAVADRLPLKLFPCGEATRIVTLYLDRRDGLLHRHALEGRGAHLRVRVKGFFAAPASADRVLLGPLGEANAAPANQVLEASVPTPGLALEVKRRRGRLTRKERVWCLPAELPALLAGVDDPRTRSIGLHRLLPGARPLCVVGYVRRVYEDPSGTLRVTIDRRLGRARAGTAELMRLAAGLPPEVPATPDAPVVAEIKHLGPLPAWIAAKAGQAEAHFSKLLWALSTLFAAEDESRRSARPPRGTGGPAGAAP